MTPHNRFTAGRVLQCLVMAKGEPGSAVAFAEGRGDWVDQRAVVAALKAIVTGQGTSGGALAPTPAAESFLQAMRSYSVPMRLQGLKTVPMRTRIYVDAAGAVAVRVAEGSGLPILHGDWSTTALEPIKHGGIVVTTDELAKSMSAVATLALSDDLAQATAEAENLSFVSPDHVGSVLYGASSFAGSGTGVAQIDADLKRLVDLVPGASKPGAAFVMTKETATFLSLVRGSGGAPAYPAITPQGGSLLGLPALITAACEQVGSPPTRTVGLVDPSSIFLADEGIVELSTSQAALLEMTDAPVGNSLTGNPAQMVSMFQSNSVALKAVRESAWYARPGAGAYFIAGF